MSQTHLAEREDPKRICVSSLASGNISLGVKATQRIMQEGGHGGCFAEEMPCGLTGQMCTLETSDEIRV